MLDVMEVPYHQEGELLNVVLGWKKIKEFLGKITLLSLKSRGFLTL